ncbi:hypothetical protein Pla52n_50660 [Stieleria varia]|uniref:Uncharacterized protein n=1 Tax=Stieleria varia TaxID=2528005 RepID=A0A5C6AGG8_9BACT|nr:hypothetical protein Pla52n_50660 [Stieleria varia]
MPRIRYSIRSLLTATIFAAVPCGAYLWIEYPRLMLIREVESNGGRIEYAPWSLQRPFLGARVMHVTVPINAYDNLDVSRLADLPGLSSFSTEIYEGCCGSCNRDGLEQTLAILDSRRDYRMSVYRLLPTSIRDRPRTLTESEFYAVYDAFLKSESHHANGVSAAGL